jgi:hypothetical protein
LARNCVYQSKETVRKKIATLDVGLGRVVRDVRLRAGSSPSGGSESTFRSDLLLTVKGISTLLSAPRTAQKLKQWSGEWYRL